MAGFCQGWTTATITVRDAPYYRRETRDAVVDLF